MKTKALAALLVLTFSAGCATQGDKRLAWEVKPVLDVHHGMVYGMAYYQLGRFHQSQGRSSAAEEAFDKALAADPDNTDALNALGALYAERGELQRSVDMFRKLAELTPSTAYLYNNIGYALYLQGRHAEAVAALRKAVTLDPGYERAWVNLQTAAREGGMPALAASAAQRELRIVASGNRPQPASGDAAPNAVAGPLVPAEPALAMAVALDSVKVQPLGSPPAPRLAGESIHAAPASVAAVARQDTSPPAIAMTEVVARPAPVEPAAGEARAIRVSTRVEPPAPAEPVLAGLAPDSGLERARLEVSNGNGVSRFATHFSARLRAAGVGVDRITNYASFAQGTSVIEYGAGFADAAQALRDRLGIDAELEPMKAPRPGTDVRLILGRDALQAPQTRA